MKKIVGGSRRAIGVKYVAVAWIVLLEVFAGVYLYANPVSGASQNPFIILTSTTTTSTSTKSTTPPPPPDRILVKSAIIENDTLMMKVDNEGPSSTESLTIMGVCTPGFQTCYGYKKLAGSSYSRTFILPAARTFLANMSGVCTIAIKGCSAYLPVANATYYLQVSFSFADGSSVVVPVAAMANDTWSRYLTAIMGVSPLLTVFPKNLTGVLNATVDVNSTELYASWTTSLEGHTSSSYAYGGTILTNKTGCWGTFVADCSAPVPVIMNFTTVLTGITAGSYYSVVVHDTTVLPNNATESGYPDYHYYPTFYFALWVQCTDS